MALDLLRLAHHARAYGGPRTKRQWLLVGAIALSLAVGLYICSSVPRNAAELLVNLGIPSASEVISLSIATMVLHW